ncbi:hypothetical protein [Streptomyces sp. NPDC059411]|uniref:hypothetical protein n=1 Tax=Streptomyces sp. NPDC059411 TaxID=3346825 RepID=UPI00368B59FA
MGAMAVAGALGAWSIAHVEPSDGTNASAPLDDAHVRRALADATAPAHAAQPPRPEDGSAATGTSTPGIRESIRFQGGSAVVECHDGRIYLVSWSPAADFTLDEVSRGPAESAALRLDQVGGHTGDLTVTLRCTAAGYPVASVHREA